MVKKPMKTKNGKKAKDEQLKKVSRSHDSSPAGQKSFEKSFEKSFDRHPAETHVSIMIRVFATMAHGGAQVACFPIFRGDGSPQLVVAFVAFVAVIEVGGRGDDVIFDDVKVCHHHLLPG